MRVFAQEEAEVERFDGLLAATYRLANRAAWLQGVTDGALVKISGVWGLHLNAMESESVAQRFTAWSHHMGVLAEAVSPECPSISLGTSEMSRSD